MHIAGGWPAVRRDLGRRVAALHVIANPAKLERLVASLGPVTAGRPGVWESVTQLHRASARDLSRTGHEVTSSWAQDGGMTDTAISMDWKLELIALPVADVDRAVAVYVDQLGWHLDHDHTLSDEVRFVQVTGPGSGCSIAIGKGLIVGEQAPIRTLQVVVADIEAAHAHLRPGHRVQPDRRSAVGLVVYFTDPDGNAWAVQQTTPRTA